MYLKGTLLIVNSTNLLDLTDLRSKYRGTSTVDEVCGPTIRGNISGYQRGGGCYSLTATGTANMTLFNASYLYSVKSRNSPSLACK